MQVKHCPLWLQQLLAGLTEIQNDRKNTVLSLSSTCGPCPPQNELPATDREAGIYCFYCFLASSPISAVPLQVVLFSTTVFCWVWSLFFGFSFESSSFFSWGRALKLPEQEPCGSLVPVLHPLRECRQHSWLPWTGCWTGCVAEPRCKRANLVLWC